MVAAKNDFAHAGLSSQLADRSLSRKYLALVWGHPSRKGQIDRPLGRSFSDRKKIAIVASGKAAITDYTLLRAVGPHASLVRCRLQTGRTHQIRVHMASIGHPLVGDPRLWQTDDSRIAQGIPCPYVFFRARRCTPQKLALYIPVMGISLLSKAGCLPIWPI